MAVEWKTDLFPTQRLVATRGDAITTAAAVLRDAKTFLQDPMNQDLPALRGESGILVNVHAGSSKLNGCGYPLASGIGPA